MSGLHLIPALHLSFVVAIVQNSPTGCFYAGESRSVGEFTLQEHFRMKCCSDGSVQELGCLTDQGLIPFQHGGQTIVIGQFRYECFKNGTQFYYQRSVIDTYTVQPEGPTGCYFGGEKYALGQEFLVADRFSYKCSSTGVAVLLGCKTDTDGLIELQLLGGSMVKGPFKYECYKNGTAPHYRRTVITQW
ncbi:hypothetical protein PRIPAC_86528 [Pristionchus pacificus]|uniref:Abnormal cell migration protein 18-like fibronectin type I domain-containing protein n=1 Tax=Pristionchus pacificus TaxID=54126 RepID=A0A2A6BLU8_PRIPA|nr:hypothetical protein PRIPAC_86528 [Pristionchus pacificus]|eukprot:PDM66828.1 hypothetical protein PRIPAC_48245 [Pristionchus pacificus]